MWQIFFLYNNASDNGTNQNKGGHSDKQKLKSVVKGSDHCGFGIVKIPLKIWTGEGNEKCEEQDDYDCQQKQEPI